MPVNFPIDTEDIGSLPGAKPSPGWSFGTGTTPAAIINAVLPFVFVIAGLILFVMFFFGGFTIFTSAGNPEKTKKGQGMIVNALIGFLIIFAAYWIIELLQITFGINILGTPSVPLPPPRPSLIPRL